MPQPGPLSAVATERRRTNVETTHESHLLNVHAPAFLPSSLESVAPLPHIYSDLTKYDRYSTLLFSVVPVSFTLGTIPHTMLFIRDRIYGTNP